MSALTGKRVIWSNQHAAYWRANSCGYVINLLGAGLYSPEEAEDICTHAEPGFEVHRDAEAEWRKLLDSASPGTVGAIVLQGYNSAPAFTLPDAE